MPTYLVVIVAVAVAAPVVVFDTIELVVVFCSWLCVLLRLQLSVTAGEGVFRVLSRCIFLIVSVLLLLKDNDHHALYCMCEWMKE